jgi:hypothetical protein
MKFSEFPKFKSLKDRYKELILSKVFIKEEDLTEEESHIIDVTFELFNEKLSDLKLLQDEIVRLSVENANLKASMDNNDYEYDEQKDDK